MTDQPAPTLETVPALSEIPRDAWDAIANPPEEIYNPFISWDFLEAMESSGSVRPETGWQPMHLALRRDAELAGVMPAYLKGHSQGEYIFDHAFADA